MSRPKCPNHAVEMQKTENRRIWICPVSGARFEAEADWDDNHAQVKKDKFGRPVHENVTLRQVDGGTGG